MRHKSKVDAADKNVLYYGDNLDVLRRYIANESVDLIYLDPPFNSNATYNILFEEQSGEGAASQIKAFEDTWTWNIETSRLFDEVTVQSGKVSEVLDALRQLLGDSNMMAYIVMMAPRLIELYRVLKESGSLYLHCDPTASHYIKILLDAIFTPQCFRNEIIWQRTNAHNFRTRRYGRVHDVILFYSKSPSKTGFTWNTQYTPYSQEQMSRFKVDPVNDRPYKAENLTMVSTSNTRKDTWRGVTPPANRAWGFSLEQREAMWSAGRILTRKDGNPRMDGWKIYLDEVPGKPVDDVWTDIPRVPNKSKQRLNYPTQKPDALLERIIKTSSDEGMVILDPFCGCGTTIAVAQRLGRKWVGIDITHLAIALIKHRLLTQAGTAVTSAYDVVGEPVSVPDAARLAADDPFQFQAWALGLVGARTEQSNKKGADKGIDGKIYFHDEIKAKTKHIVLSVKAGKNISVAMVRDLVGTVTRERAQMGVLITMTSPTGPMIKEAAIAGIYTSPMGGKHPMIQILTIEDLLDGRGIDYPAQSQRSNVTYKSAQRNVSGDKQTTFLSGVHTIPAVPRPTDGVIEDDEFEVDEVEYDDGEDDESLA